MEIKRVERDIEGALAELFFAYRRFYEQPDDRDRARRFLSDRLARGESLVWVAVRSGTPVGFTQVYRQFSSLRLTTTWVLNDLYVAPEARGTGAGRALVERVLTEAAAAAVAGVRLETRRDNAVARALYEHCGFSVAPTAPSEFVTYEKALSR